MLKLLSKPFPTTRLFTVCIHFQIAFHPVNLSLVSPRYIGVNPNEVVWKSLKISWSARLIRRIAVMGFVTALIVFWAIPVAAVGLISNIQYLTTYSWLEWLNKIPDVIMGVVSGLLPSVALAILMSLVPIIMRSECPPSNSRLNTDISQSAPSKPVNQQQPASNCSHKTPTSYSKLFKSSWS